MKNKILVLLSFIVVLSMLLAACSNNSGQAAGSSSDTAQSSSLSQVNVLLVGTLKLDESDNPVTVDQAAQLLPLWQAYRTLSTSQTAAEAEVDGLLKQIENTMTDAQQQAIQAMNLTNSDMLALMQSMGGMGPQGTPDPNATPGADFSGRFQSDGFPAGGMQNGPSFSTGDGSAGPSGNRPSGGGAMPGGGAIIVQGGPGMGDAGGATGLGDGSMLQGTPDPTQQARFITQASQVNSLLLNVLISRLEALAAN